MTRYHRGDSAVWNRMRRAGCHMVVTFTHDNLGSKIRSWDNRIHGMCRTITSPVRGHESRRTTAANQGTGDSSGRQSVSRRQARISLVGPLRQDILENYLPSQLRHRQSTPGCFDPERLLLLFSQPYGHLFTFLRHGSSFASGVQKHCRTTASRNSAIAMQRIIAPELLSSCVLKELIAHGR